MDSELKKMCDELMNYHGLTYLEIQDFLKHYGEEYARGKRNTR